jgi:hypothetical protein
MEGKSLKKWRHTMNKQRWGIKRFVTKVTRAFPIFLIIGGMVLSFASQPLPVVGMSGPAQAGDSVGMAKQDALWKSGDIAKILAREGYDLIFLDPAEDIPVCLPEPTTLSATVQAVCPKVKAPGCR